MGKHLELGDLTEDEQTALAALDELLDLTCEVDWPLTHAVVRSDVDAGKFGSEFEAAYRALVNRKIAARAA